MKHYASIFLIPMLLLVACHPEKSKDKVESQEQLVLKPFSDSLSVDTFKVALTGDHLNTMRIEFSIKAHTGQLIYNKQFKAQDLISNYRSSVDLKKEESQLSFIRNEYKLFLADENFLEPAVTENENPDHNTPDKSFYQELKRSGRNGFKYRTGKETSIYIAWSDSQSSVKPYYECCQ